MAWQRVSAQGIMGSLDSNGESTINAENHILGLKQHMPPSRQRLFQGHPRLFQLSNTK